MDRKVGSVALSQLKRHVSEGQNCLHNLHYGTNILSVEVMLLPDNPVVFAYCDEHRTKNKKVGVWGLGAPNAHLR